MTVHWRVDGPTDGVPLVLINGLFADLTSWDGAMPHLSDYRVLRYDSRGQGLSHKPEGDYHMAALMEDLQRVLDEARWPVSWFIGLSNGGSIALEAARLLPQRTLGLIAADCYAEPTPLAKLKIGSWLRAHEVGGPEHRFDIATPWIWSNQMLSEHPELVAHYREKASSHEDQAVRGLLQGALTHRVAIEQIEAPALLIAGEEDILTPPFEMRAMAARMQKAQFRTVPGAHASLLEHPEIIADVVLPFIQEVAHVAG